MAFPRLPGCPSLLPHRPKTPAPVPAPVPVSAPVPALPVIEGTEPAPGSPEALQLLAGLALDADDPRFEPEALTKALQRWLRIKVWLEQLSDEQKQIQEQLRLAHFRGDLQQLLPQTPDGSGYVIAPTTALIRRKGRRQWRYSPTVQELDCQLRARQDYEQRSGDANYSLGAGYWELRTIKGA
jgi:hypothetical protein